jgi:phosphoenolpyruvate carboxylase
VFARHDMVRHKSYSCGGVIPNLLKEGHLPEDIWKALLMQTTKLVLTAHPTDVNCHTILEKKRCLQGNLIAADNYCAISHGHNTGIQEYERDELDRAVHREISSIWLSDEVSRVKRTTVMEHMRKLDVTCLEFLGK